MVISWNKENALALVTGMPFQKRQSPMYIGEKKQDPLTGIIGSG